MYKNQAIKIYLIFQIELGSTMVRVGSAIFGARQMKK